MYVCNAVFEEGMKKKQKKNNNKNNNIVKFGR